MSLNEAKLIFEEKTPMSQLWVGLHVLEFDGDINDFKEHFPNYTITETEGAGIWIIT